MKKKNDLTESIISIGERCGADLVGVAAVEEVTRLAPGCDPARFLPGATNIVIALVADPPGITETESEREYNAMAFAGYQKADAAVLNIQAAIKRNGYIVKMIVRSNVTARDASGKFTKTIPLKQCAQAAGLGKIGLHSLLVTEKFGPRIRMSGIITDAPLNAGTPAENSLCDNCRKCVRECPSGAIPEKDGKNSFALCSAYLFGGIKGNEIMSALNVFDPDLIGQNVRGMAKALTGWGDSLAQGRRLYYTCGRCIQVCDVHERKAARAKKKLNSDKNELPETGIEPV